MRRSMLFLPGNTPNMIINGDALGADSIILDLEDAVSPDEKDSARLLVRSAMKNMGFAGCEITVRINSIDTDYWKDDLEAVIPLKPDLIMPPKASCAEDMRIIDGCISIDETEKKLIAEIMSNEIIYIYDVTAEKRNDILKICFEAGKDVYLSTKISDIQLRASYLTQDSDQPCFYCPRPAISKKAAVVKRFFDIVISIIGLILTSWLFLIVAIAIKIEDGGRVFYRQDRCTKDGKIFSILKFRSMIEHIEEGKIYITKHKDNRITKVGYIIRKTKIDELPQLVNILKGDMSLVGPRPERPELIADILKEIPEYNFRTTVKAGLTGYAQVHGDYHTDFLEKLRWDMIYIENYSIILDLKILLMTIPTILRGSSDV